MLGAIRAHEGVQPRLERWEVAFESTGIHEGVLHALVSKCTKGVKDVSGRGVRGSKLGRGRRHGQIAYPLRRAVIKTEISFPGRGLMKSRRTRPSGISLTVAGIELFVSIHPAGSTTALAGAAKASVPHPGFRRPPACSAPYQCTSRTCECASRRPPPPAQSETPPPRLLVSHPSRRAWPG